jgi:MFS family permease
LSRISSYARALSLGVPFKAFTRDIWLICLSNVIGAFGEGLYFWVFPIYIRQLQADYVQLGLVFSALYGVSAFAPLPGGILADRFDRKKVLILSWTPWIFAPLLYSFAQNWVQLIPGAICWGISMIGAPAISAYVVTSVVDKRNLASVLSFVWSSYSFSYIFAPTVGVFLVSLLGMQWVLRLAAVLCAMATGIFFLLRSQHPRKNEAEKKQPLSPAMQKRLWRKVLLWSSFFTATTFFLTTLRPFVPTFLADQSKLSEFYVGLFGSVNFAGITFIGIAMGRLSDSWPKSSAISLCLFLYTVSMVPLLSAREPLTFMFAAFLYGSSMVMGSLVGSYVGTIAPVEKQGRWISIPQTFSLVAATIAPYLGGYLYMLSPYYAFTVSIVSMPFLVFIALAVLKE